MVSMGTRAVGYGLLTQRYPSFDVGVTAWAKGTAGRRSLHRPLQFTNAKYCVWM